MILMSVTYITRLDGIISLYQQQGFKMNVIFSYSRHYKNMKYSRLSMDPLLFSLFYTIKQNVEATTQFVSNNFVCG